MVSFFWAGVYWRVSFGFLAGVAAFLFADAGGFALAFLGAAVLHESGHLLVMACFNVPVRCVRLTLGGMYIQRGDCAGFLQELLVLVAGAAVNMLAAMLLFSHGTDGSLRFSAANAALAFFHLLPFGGMDGGSIAELICVRLFGLPCGLWVSRLCALAAFLFCAVALLLLARGYGLTATTVMLWLLLICTALAPGRT